MKMPHLLLILRIVAAGAGLLLRSYVIASPNAGKNTAEPE
jgi:hypothetical protein